MPPCPSCSADPPPRAVDVAAAAVAEAVAAEEEVAAEEGAAEAAAEVAEAAEPGEGKTTMLAKLPALGVGLGFRTPFRGDLFLNRGQVDFLEITADHYFDALPEKQRELELLADHFTLIPHG